VAEGGPGALLVVTADHGNADVMRDGAGNVVTAHSLSPVPLLVAGTGAPRDRIASRLTTLVEAGVLEKRQYQSGPPRFEYHLTDSGRALLPVLEDLLAWGRTYAVSPADPDLKRRRWAPLTDDLPGETP